MKNNFSITKITFLLGLISMLFLFSSCATIFCGAKQKITVTGNVDTPVQLLVDNKTYTNVTFPTKVKIKRRGKISTITAFAPGYGVEKQDLEKSFNSVTLLNNVAWYGYLIDLASGAIRKSKQKYVYFDFQRTNSNQEYIQSYFDFGMEYYRNDHLGVALSYFQRAYEIDTTSTIALEKINAVYKRMDYLELQARLKAERSEATYNALMGVANALTTTAEVIGTAQSSNSYSDNEASSVSGSGSGGCNCAVLQDLWNRNVRNMGSSGSTYGRAKAQEQIGAITAGERGDNSGSNANLKMQSGKVMRSSQREIERIERQARKCGCVLR